MVRREAVPELAHRLLLVSPMRGTWRKLVSSVVAAMASLSWLACSGPNPDDGPCGLAGGPNQSATLFYSAIVDQAQTLKVELGAGAKGECGTSASFWLDSSGTLAPRPA